MATLNKVFAQDRKWLTGWVIFWTVVIILVAIRGEQARSQEVRDNHALILYVCKTENARWQKVQEKLTANMQRAPGETNQEYRQRVARTRNFLDGIYNVPCTTEKEATQ